jgi:hypothetical protein
VEDRRFRADPRGEDYVLADGDEGNAFWGRAIAVAFLLAAGGAVVAAFSYGVEKFGSAAHAVDQAEHEPTRRPGAPTYIEVKKLQTALRKKLGTNDRGLPRVTLVEYDDWPDRLTIVFPLDTVPPPQAEGAKSRAQVRPLRDVLEQAHAGGLNWSWVLLSGTAPTRGYFGGPTETTVVRAVFSRKTLDGADWSRLTDETLAAMAEQFTTDPDLGEVPGVAKEPPPHREGPTTAITTNPPADGEL